MPGATPRPEGSLESLDVNAVRRWAVLVRSALAARRAEIDALNVFPVPDGDTGTNLYLTFDGAVEATLSADAHPGAGVLLRDFAANLLWTARGNSGVILSQLARGLAEGVGDVAVVDPAGLVAGLVRADERAWQAVTDPKEGTILSVSRAAADGARSAAAGSLVEVCTAAVEGARIALAHTTEQLEVLARAGVVDAGGAGYLLILECLERLCAGDDSRTVLGVSGVDRRGRFRPDSGFSVSRPLDADIGPTPAYRGPEYEVMYLLADSDDPAVDVLRARLVELGDSVLAVGGDGQWNIHAHVDDVGAAVEAGIEAGRPHRVRVTRLVAEDGTPLPGDGETHAQAADSSASSSVAVPPAPGAPGTHSRAQTAPPSPVAVSGLVACAAGAGLGALFEEVGAVVVASGPGRRASTGQLIEAIRRQHESGVTGIVVLPNDTDTELAAAAAVRAAADDGIDAHLVRARTAVQGIAALAVFEPGASAAANVLGMQSAASATRHGAVTVANRAGLTSGGPCQPGDILGIVDGDIVIVGEDQAVVGREVVRRLLGSGGELLTVVVGEGAPAGLVEAISAEARAQHRGIELTRIDGGQPVYSVLIGVE